MASVWDQMTPQYLLGMGSTVPASAHSDRTPSLARSAGPAAGGEPHPLSPDSPLFWFGLVALATFGFVAFSTSIRLGPARGSIGLGKT